MLYAIREKKSGDFIVQVPANQRGGGTACHLMPMRHAVPRLFTTRGAAACALTWWLQGAWSGGRYDEDGPSCDPQPDRTKLNMEIVEMELKVK